MRNSSSDSSKGARPGAKPFNKSAGPSKKNYDGRSSSAGTEKNSRSDKPYSGRATDSDRPKRSFDKPGFKRSEGDAAGGNRKPRAFDKPFKKDGDSRSFSDRPKRAFDNPDFKKRDNDNHGEERKPRSFDKPFKKDSDSRPFSDRPKRAFDKPDFKKRENDNHGEERKPRSFDKPFKKDSDSRPFSDRPKRAFDKPDFKKRDGNGHGEERKPRSFDKPFSDKPKRAFDKPAVDNGAEANETERPHKSFSKPGRTTDSRPFRDRPKPAAKPAFDKKDAGKKSKDEKEKKTFTDVVNNVFNQPAAKKDEDHPGKREQFEDKVYGELEDAPVEDRPKKPFEIKKKDGNKKYLHDHSEGRKKKYKDEDYEDEDDKEINQKDGPRLEMPLNKYIAHSGECSRRDAADLVKQGKVKVNGELVLDPGYRVLHDDKVTMSGKKLVPQKGMVYILLNKPKGFITTNDDPQGRKKVMDLVGNSGVDRLFPVGRLDRDTSGLLLITNDGELTQKLCHPSYNIKKVYQVTLDKAFTKADFEKVIEGVELEDGKAVVDALSYLEKKNELGLEIHSGRNRIVRRIFESLGYVVDKLDRVMYAGLTKKNLPRSKWRYLDEREIVLLKHFKN